MQVPDELVIAAKRGDPGAFDDLVRTTYRGVYNVALRLVGNPDDAADVTQDVYIRVWRSLRTFRGDANAGTWLHRVATNAALTHVKKAARTPTPTEQAELPETPTVDGSAAHADADLLERAMATLVPAQRTVVVLKDVYGWSCADIAKELGTTEGAVKVRLFRARQRLADELASTGVVVPLSKRKKTS